MLTFSNKQTVCEILISIQGSPHHPIAAQYRSKFSQRICGNAAFINARSTTKQLLGDNKSPDIIYGTQTLDKDGEVKL